MIEAKELLGTFDGSLREYAARKLVAQGVKLRRVSEISQCVRQAGTTFVCVCVSLSPPIPVCLHTSTPATLMTQGVVKCVEQDSLTLTDNTVMPFGLCIWSTGVGPTPFTLSLPFAKTKVGRIAVGEYKTVVVPLQVVVGR